MRDWHLAAFAVALLASINIWGWLGTRTPEPDRYEFRVASYPDDDMPMALNRDGMEGWRVVTCRRAVEEVAAQTIVSDRVTRALYECVLERVR